MDILASVLAYLVCVTGVVTGLVMSFMVLLSVAGLQSLLPQQSVAMLTKPAMVETARSSPVTTIAKIKQTNNRVGAAAAAAESASPVTVAADARQKSLFSQARLRRLAEKERARHLALRERSSFETRFLRYDD